MIFNIPIIIYFKPNDFFTFSRVRLMVFNATFNNISVISWPTFSMIKLSSTSYSKENFRKWVTIVKVSSSRFVFVFLYRSNQSAILIEYGVSVGCFFSQHEYKIRTFYYKDSQFLIAPSVYLGLLSLAFAFVEEINYLY